MFCTVGERTGLQCTRYDTQIQKINTNTNANTNTVVESTGSVGAGSAGKGLGVVEAAQHVVASAQNYHRKVTIGFLIQLLTLFLASA